VDFKLENFLVSLHSLKQWASAPFPIDLEDESCTRNITTNTDISMSMYSFDSESYLESDSDSDGTMIPVYV
jgi:hypothetical protein